MAALANYSEIVAELGYSHALADSNPNNDDPPSPAPQFGASRLSSPPSAGGPGQGLADKIGIGLIEALDIPVPDGDPDKLDLAITVWNTMATGDVIVNSIAILAALPGRFDAVKTDEAQYIAEDLRGLHTAAVDLQHACGELAQSCRDHRAAIGELRDKLTEILKDMAIEAGMTLAFGAVASVFSFGLAAGAAVAKGSHTVVKAARAISAFVGSWKIAKKIAEGVKASRDLKRLKANLQRIKDLTKKEKPKEKLPTKPKVSSRADAEKILDEGATLEKDKKSIIKSKDGGSEQAQKDFERITEGQEVTTYPNGTKVARLPDGSDISLRSSSDGRVTISIQQKGTEASKYRYNP
ncbi:hypothetical protein [Nocardia altamirensis]|uniref:hypothetical protein n=1 Tax=Nocardia altamirensis TaxID=472158 RepID=UPI00114D1270|nr:hypothetical protein [Nocardia altamirensis]